MVEEISIEYYEADNGKCPFVEWQRTLTPELRAQIRRRLNRIRIGNFGDCKPIEGIKGVYELRIHIGPGYRIYYSRKRKLIIILCAGSKKNQKKDIIKTKKFNKDLLLN